jgi:hypothetical protein
MKSDEGWAFMVDDHWHYFRGFRSLCGEYVTLSDKTQVGDNSLDNCKVCQRIRDREKENESSV